MQGFFHRSLKMDLYDLAISYKTQFLDNYYLIKTQNDEIVIYSKPFNFLHLTGLQRCPALPQYKEKEEFYSDCLNHKYPNSDLLVQSLKNKSDKNIVNIKLCYFKDLQQTILNSEWLYVNNDDRYTCNVVASNNKQRFQTCVFTYNTKYNCYIPKSNQVDLDKKYSCVNNCSKTKVKSCKCINITSEKGIEIFNKYIKQNRVT